MSITIQPSRGVPLADRSVIASKRGVPWWAAVLGAFAMTGIGIAIDLTLGDTLTRIFLIFYAFGCVAAVLAVAHKGIFAVMVQPPLILAVAVPLVVNALGTPAKGGMRDKMITLALPLVNGFPTMALTTLATVLLGTARIVIQRRAYPADTPERAVANQESYRPRGGFLHHDDVSSQHTGTARPSPSTHHSA
ncbi:MAG: DUF6542 domain-containing protein [Mycobacteriaceae bacterium]